MIHETLLRLRSQSLLRPRLSAASGGCLGHSPAGLVPTERKVHLLSCGSILHETLLRLRSQSLLRPRLSAAFGGCLGHSPAGLVPTERMVQALASVQLIPDIFRGAPHPEN